MSGGVDSSVAAGLLLEEGYEDITLANDGAHAVQLIDEAIEPFQCVLIDMVMPKMDGVALCKHVRANPCYRQTPVLMVTALADEISVDRAFIAGANDFVTKPLNVYEIAGRVRSAAILVEQTNRKLALERSVNQLEAVVVNLSKPRLSQATMLEAGPNCLSVQELEDMLNALPSGVYAMSCFAVHISEASTLLVRTPEDEFKAVLTGVAEHISAELGTLNHNFAYSGNATFGCVAFGRKARLNTDKGLNCLGIKEKVYGIPALGEASELSLSFREQRGIPLLSGEQAVKCIRDCVAGLSEAETLAIQSENAHDKMQFARPLKPVYVADFPEIEKISRNLFLD